ncbi:MAG: hypothetical protein A2845_03190 [Candidatus Lloydbacteria bacterium RIFCSPHIGHO2_01_FULL_49_22]|uniref:Response regulatory domain-containing protein n=1 Tax=Candidatus Lloydbacteria bacterium RIFCSPHIGHO2_01_FULL_49_22 TaxID=1798658 RepID=A0A1G2CVN5_9BACT|nr:MAG: hypothetical protein A2845_03190 [Candidatus Lloydbacteria bacterium RIFCSPHIGHO2_01_FULL_49_22]OGZ09886.1 MAG: hypothetical protein A3C14_03030 [Candidatus Lloydbacteria bacterium RIFCSPHIGHO2_02_FULL_50_18]
MNNEQHTVLIVEDDQILLRMLANMLKEKGLIVLEAKNGLEGMAQIGAAIPDLMLLDIDMPQMDGIAMLRNLKENNIKVSTLMLTNLTNSTYIADAAELGVNEFLVKSDWEIDDIVTKVEEKLLRAHHS